MVPLGLALALAVPLGKVVVVLVLVVLVPVGRDVRREICTDLGSVSDLLLLGFQGGSAGTSNT